MTACADLPDDDEMARARRLAACAHALYEAERAYRVAVDPTRYVDPPWSLLGLDDKRRQAVRIQDYITRGHAVPLPDDPIERGLVYLRRQIIAAMCVSQSLAIRSPR